MNPHYTYLLADALTLLFPLLLSFDRKVAFYKSWQYLWLPVLLTGAFFIVWDALFTKCGVWGFNDAYILGPRVFSLPLEEWLFFLAVPYSCLFVYACVKAYLPQLKDSRKGWPVLLFGGLALLITGLVFYQRAYTFSALSFCGAAMLLLYLLRKKITAFRPLAFLVAYAICLVPFLIVNGFLTALPVVIYNDAENLGLRLYTIPAEDIFYGMLLILASAAGTDYLESRRTPPGP